MTSNKNITELKDNSVRHKLILRYLEVETSLEEEHLLTDYYSQARENELTKEDLTIRTILLGTSAKEEIALSGSAATEFDRIIADSQTQRMSSKSIKQPKETIKFIRISAILLAAAMLTGLIFFILPTREQRNQGFISQTSSKIVCQNTETGLTDQEIWEKEDSIFLANEQRPVKRTASSLDKEEKNSSTKETKSCSTKEAKNVSTPRTEDRTRLQMPSMPSEPNVLELFDKYNEIASLLLPTTEQVGMEYDGENSILTITDEHGATYQYKIQADKDNGEDYQLSPLASITPTDIDEGNL